MKNDRRRFLTLLGAAAGVTGLDSFPSAWQSFFNVSTNTSTNAVTAANKLSAFTRFVPVHGPMPLLTDGTAAKLQSELYSTYHVKDDIVLPQGFSYDVIAAWGEKVGKSRYGYNNDYLSYVETAKNAGYLTINFEYISSKPWLQSYREVIGKDLPIAEIQEAMKAAGGEMNAFSLADDDPVKLKIRELIKEALTDQGMGVISVRKNANGKWERSNSNQTPGG